MPKRKSTKNLLNVTNFLYEVGILAHTPRSGFQFLGSGEQSVSEHVFRNVIVGYTLAQMNGKVDTLKVIKMCLFHDLAEARTSDLNYVHQKYVKTEEQAAIDDLASTLPFGEDIKTILKEYEERKTHEAIIAKDADNIEWILSLREEQDTGNTRAASWVPPSVKRLKTKEAKALAEQILATNSDDWWFSDKEDEWWVNRSKKKSKRK